MTPAEFKVIRKNYKLTQGEMAEQLGVSRLTVFNWEKGKFALPADIVERLAKANLAAPAQQAEASKVVCIATHPQCFHVQSGKHALSWRNLNHPRWWAGVSSPFERFVDAPTWQKEWERMATVAEYKAYVPPTPEQALAIMVARGIPDADARQYLTTMGYPGYSAPQKRLTMAEMTGGEITDDTIGT